jgi:DNA/RNA endonuclease YhcR with UshA esterase domain
VTLEMEVKAATVRGTVCFLNSEKDFRDPKNFTVFIDKDALARFKEAKIDDPAAHYKGKIVRVEGKVVLYQKRPEIKVSGPDDIKIVEKKE